jgi:hypothetical protein
VIDEEISFHVVRVCNLRICHFLILRLVTVAVCFSSPASPGKVSARSHLAILSYHHKTYIHTELPA